MRKRACAVLALRPPPTYSTFQLPEEHDHLLRIVDGCLESFRFFPYSESGHYPILDRANNLYGHRTKVKTQRAITSRSIFENERSAWLSQDE